MKKLLFLASLALLATSVAVAQNYQPTSDVLGAHQNGGRGCAGCHTPHSGAFGSGQKTLDNTSGNEALWGQDMTPVYGKTFIFGNESDAIGTVVTAATGWGDVEGKGLVMCLSCHDGNVTKTNMMAGVSYEQKMGILPAVYGSNPIPTLLGADGTTAGNYLNDHPVGKGTHIDMGDWADPLIGVTFQIQPAGSRHMVKTTVAAGKQYDNFQQVYSSNSLNALTSDGTNIFPVCTTCHNQHIMNVATATIAGVTGTYQSFFFVRDPYNPGAQTMGVAVAGVSQSLAGSTTQFCRQCHFGDSNERNGAAAKAIPTAF